MINISSRSLLLYPLMGLIAACSSSRKLASKDQDSIRYDDSTLQQASTPYLLPYNRIIDGAGTSLTWGNDEQENHSLDAVLMPDKKSLIIEDRFGIAVLNIATRKIVYRFVYDDKNGGKSAMSTYSGIKVWLVNGQPHIFWSAANSSTKQSFVFEADWSEGKSSIMQTYNFDSLSPSPLALPNDIALQEEKGETYLYVVLNGNSELVKIRRSDKRVIWQVATGMAPFGITIAHHKAYVSNWGGPVPTDTSREQAGIPYAGVYVKHTTGGTAMGTVSIIDLASGQTIKEIPTGLHPNAIITSKDEAFVYVANANNDNVSVISTQIDRVVDSISVRLNGHRDDLLGDSPNALALSEDNKTLYVANGLDNAVAVVGLGEHCSSYGSGATEVKGFIPTQAYPGGVVLNGGEMYVTNLEGVGARVEKNKAFNSHKQAATVSIIPVPGEKELAAYTQKVKELSLQFRASLSSLLPRKNIAPRPIPERIGEPSTIRHVIYIIKENRTYDQVLGDMREGRGERSLCVFGDSVTPNEHALARQYGLLDNYYASGKSSAEGHQWTDAAMVTDYLERNVRAWFRSYPHVQQDALVYSDAGFIWNNALDHGRTVRIFGEACEPVFDEKLHWKDIYQLYTTRQPFVFTNKTTISRVEPILSPTYPGYDNHSINDQLRADAFIAEWRAFENNPGTPLPALLIVALPADHTAGMRPGYPTPRAMVADNDLALGRIVEAVTNSRFWDSTAIFVTEDDSQDGWDHISAYRTTGFVISPYSSVQKVIHTNYNQTAIVRTIEQILGIPPMNKIDATASPMFDCFEQTARPTAYHPLPNRIPLNEMNKELAEIKGKDKKFAQLSMQKQFDHIDGGNDDLMNRIIWHATMGKIPYPSKMTLGLKDDD
jgi:hypothetical protein